MLSAERDPAEARKVHVRVVHGNLAFTRHPVAVGHYSGDTIVSAEKHLDRALNGALSDRLHLGLYPGPIGTNAVFTNPRLSRDRYARPGGAIVVGLGTVGQLTASLLTRSFSKALLEFVLERRKCQPTSSEAEPAVRLAALLIGTGAGGMSVSDSVLALVRGAQGANQALSAARHAEWIADLEVIELYEDRAIVALEALHRLARRSRRDDDFTLAPELAKRDGGLHRVSYDDDAPEWWHRLQVKGAAEDGKKSAGLRFAAVTRRARTEVRLLPTQRAIVDGYIQDASQTRHNAKIGRTLFDLLLPNELKEAALDTDNLVLLLDEESARYPWELLEAGGDDEQAPLVIGRGLLRQLESKEFRGDVRGSAESNALVIGDPVSPFLELDGAQREAKAVAEALEASFAVTSKIRGTSQDVITALFERPYKLLHLAGHGVFRYAAPDARRCDTCGADVPADGQTGEAAAETVTGMVIGDGVFLTPGEVEQMPIVPDLVFINCCHLGRSEPGKVDATPQERAFPRLAANLATQFIDMGVRAVVAAGWAVDDTAATTFASAFYAEMLAGETFGEAVTAARKRTFENHRQSNTWGAYQCYGDPDFRLVLDSQRARAEDTAPTFLSKAQALRDIGNIAARLKTQSAGAGGQEVARLDAIVGALETRQWLQTGAVAAALGRAYGEAGLLERAIGHYSTALMSEDGAITVRDVEQCANLMGRLAVHRWSRNRSDPTVTKESRQVIEKAIHILKDLLGGLGTALGLEDGQRFTSERLALIGSAYKRLAWVDPGGRAGALREMAGYYRQAAEQARARGLGTAYPLLNVRWAGVAMRWQGVEGADELLADLAQELTAVRHELSKERPEGPQFWQDSLRVDCELLETVHAGPLTRERVGALADEYVTRRDYASAREFASICDHLDFLVVMSEPVGDLTPLLAELRKRVDPAPP